MNIYHIVRSVLETLQFIIKWVQIQLSCNIEEACNFKDFLLYCANRVIGCNQNNLPFGKFEYWYPSWWFLTTFKFAKVLPLWCKFVSWHVYVYIYQIVLELFIISGFGWYFLGRLKWVWLQYAQQNHFPEVKDKGLKILCVKLEAMKITQSDRLHQEYWTTDLGNTSVWQQLQAGRLGPWRTHSLSHLLTLSLQRMQEQE